MKERSPVGGSPDSARQRSQKFFGSFFQKRTAFLLSIAIAIAIAIANAQATPRTEAAAQLSQAERERAAQAHTQITARRDLRAAQAQAARLADARAAQAAALQTVDGQVTAASAGLAVALARQDAADQALARTRAAFAALLPAMLRVSQAPDAAVLAAPAPAEDALRGLLVLRGLAVTLDRAAGRWRAAQAEAASAQAAAGRQAAALAQTRAEQASRAAALDRVVAEARGQVGEAEAEGRDAAAQVARAAAQARTLREAIAAMDAAQARAVALAARDAAEAGRRHQDKAAQAARARQVALSAPPGPGLRRAAGQLVVPVAGPVLRGFGAASEDGPASGVTFAAAAGAFVGSPCAGRVAFAAPFRSYGQLVIVACGGGTDVVLAGLGAVGATPGRAVRQGEPVGRMPAGRPSLYMELRAAGRAVDPAPFLRGAL